MVSSMKRVLTVVRTCKKAVRTCFKKLRRLPLSSCMCFKLKCDGDDEKWVTDEMFKSTDDSREATVCTEPGRMSTKLFVTHVDVHKASTYCQNGNECEKQLSKKTKRRRRKKTKPVAETTSQKTSDDVSLSTVTPCSDLKKKNNRFSTIFIDVNEQPEVAEGLIKNQQKQRSSHSDDKLCVREKRNDQTTEKPSGYKAKAGRALKKKQVDALNCKSANTAVTKPLRNTSEEVTARRKAILTNLSSKSELKSNGAENARVPGTAAKNAVANTTNAGSKTKLQDHKTEKFNQKAKSVTAENVTDVRMNIGLPKGIDRKDKVAKNTSNWKNLCVENVLPPVSTDSKIVKSVIPINVVETGFETRVDDEIRRVAKEMIIKYEKSQNLNDIIFSLTNDKNSCIRTRHQQFVTCTTILTLDGTSKRRMRVGKMFAGLVAKKVLIVNAITQGIDTVLRDCNGYLTKHPRFFSYVAAIVAPLLISNTASFEYFNLKDACLSLRPDDSSLFFVEVLQTILHFEDSRSVTEFCGTLRLFYKWSLQSKHVPLEVFMPGNQINKFVKNDRVGPLILAMAMFDVARTTIGNTSLCDMTHKWISSNIDADILKEPCFVRTLSIATVIVCTNKPKSDSNEDLIDRGREKLLNRFIRHEFPAAEIRSREVECIEGCVAISTALGEKENYGGMSFKVFFQLYRDRAICMKSLVTWKNEAESPTKTATAAMLKSFFKAIESLKSCEIKT